VTPVRVADITIGNRYRKDLGDIASLAASMKEVGLLQPIVLNSKLGLILGARRIEAAKLLGWQSIPAAIVERLDDALLALKAERDESEHRLKMKPTELVSLGRVIEAIEKPAAAERKAATQARPGEGKVGGVPGAPPKNKGKTRDRVGRALGVKGETFERAKQVVEAAEQNPDTFGDLPQKMDASSVASAYRELQERKAKAEGQSSAPPPPSQPFDDLVSRCRELSRDFTKACKQDTEQGRRLHEYLGVCGLLDYAPGVFGAEVAAFIPLRGVPAVIKLVGEPGPRKLEQLVKHVYMRASGGWIPPLTARRRQQKGNKPPGKSVDL
jgi:hypothetical protein